MIFILRTKIHLIFGILCLNLVFTHSDCVPTTRPADYRMADWVGLCLEKL